MNQLEFEKNLQELTFSNKSIRLGAMKVDFHTIISSFFFLFKTLFKKKKFSFTKTIFFSTYTFKHGSKALKH